MSATWVLVICAGITGWGCGTVSKGTYATKAECYEALTAVRFDIDTESELRRSAYAYCKPSVEEAG